MIFEDTPEATWIYVAATWQGPYRVPLRVPGDVPRWQAELYAATRANPRVASKIVLWSVDDVARASPRDVAPDHAVAILTAILDTTDLDRLGAGGVVALCSTTGRAASLLPTRRAFLGRAVAWLRAHDPACDLSCVRWWREGLAARPERVTPYALGYGEAARLRAERLDRAERARLDRALADEAHRRILAFAREGTT